MIFRKHTLILNWMTLKNKLSILIDQPFNPKQSTSRNRFFTVPRDDSKESRWTRNAFDDSKNRKCIDASKLKRWLHFLVDNIYLNFGKETVLRQIIRFKWA